MSSAEYLRELISERLTAAAEEIFQGFQRTIAVYEEEIHRQRRLLDVVLRPELKLHRTDLLKQHVYEKQDVLVDQQLCNQERNSSLDQYDPESPQIKEEQEEICSSLEGEQLLMKQETEAFMVTPTGEDSDYQTLLLSPDETQSEAENENGVSMSEPEPNSHDQLLSHNSHVAESQDHKGGKQGDLGSTRNAKKNSQERCYESKYRTNNADNSIVLQIHSNSYTGAQSFKCDACGKTFKHNYILHRHLRVHTGEKPYACNTCGKRFSVLDTLKVHMRIHTGEKPFNCKTCGKGFRCLAGLKAHLRIHTGEKPYNCTVCGKDFRRSTDLKRHMVVHTGEKPYACNTCQKRFSHLDALKVHMRIHTDEKPYNCKTCGNYFRSRYQLKIHVRTHAVGNDCFR